MKLSTQQLVWALIIAGVLGGSLAIVLWKQRQEYKKLKKKKAEGKTRESNFNSVQMQLQAYERLILLAERISLSGLINRIPYDGVTAREMQALLTETIRQEFDHNITQQIYVTPEAWDAIKNLKEQNIFIVNQVASFLQPEATAVDLNKQILEMLLNNPKASLHGVVEEALSYEARKVLQAAAK